MTESLEERLRRLEQERDEADRRYNEALTQLDRAVPRHAPLPDPPLPLDEQQLATLNQAWNILETRPAAAGMRQAIASVIWRVVAPYFQRQLRFNSILVDHINRNAEAERAAHRTQMATIAALREQIDALAVFHGRLISYLQQITAYVDTKDRQSAGGALVLNAAISNVAEAQAKYRESLAAREHRYESRTASIATAQEELRDMIGVSQQAIAALKRALTERPASAQSKARAPEGTSSASDAFAPSLDAYKYVGFEEQFRGSQEVIRARQASYVPFFERPRTSTEAGAVTGDVVDIGCGRGEFIELLKARGIPARGVDLNEEMVQVCQARGLEVVQADAVGYLAGEPDSSLGGIFAAQVVEHLEPAYLLRLLDLSFEKLQPGGVLVLETLNPACWTAFFESYIRDITHRWPLHPETLKYLVTASGFTRVSVEFRSPIAKRDQLQAIDMPAGEDALLAEMTEVFNANVDKLNARMFSHMDYAVVAQK